MPRELYNEGRVVGYSAYEMYLRHHLGIDPDHSPASEKEWLASMMAMGSSMLLRIGTDTTEGPHYIEVEFPKGSRLCAANNILASFFSGEGYVESDPNGESTGWATKVTDYGPLIANSSALKSPSNDGTLVPSGSSNGEFSDTTVMQIREYMKIVDGIVLQPGTWSMNVNKPPYKDFKPMLSTVPKLRISFSDKVETPFYILLTGFTNRTVVDGQTGFDSAVNTQSPSDGDFLGPWAFPWTAKIFFHVPSSFVNYFMNNKYARELKKGTTALSVKSDAIVDFKHSYDENYQPEYYKTQNGDAKLVAQITNINVLSEDAAIIASYGHSRDFGTTDNPEVTTLPPALYGALIENSGTKFFIPLDSVAPGALKLYKGDITSISINSPFRKSMTLQSQAPGASAFMREEGNPSDSDSKSAASYVVYELNQNNSIVPVSNDYYASLYGSLTNYEVTLPYIAFQNNMGDEPNSCFFDIVANRRLTGRLSNTFKDKYGISYDSDKLQALIKYDVNKSIYDTIAPGDRKNYYYILRGPKNGEAQGAQWALIPVRIKDGLIDYVEKVYYAVGVNVPFVTPKRNVAVVPVQEGDLPYKLSEGSSSYTTDVTHRSVPKGSWVTESGKKVWVWEIDGEHILWEQDSALTDAERAGWLDTCSNFNFMGSYWNNATSPTGPEEAGLISHGTLSEYLVNDKKIETAFVLDGGRLMPSVSNWETVYSSHNLNMLKNSDAIKNAIYSKYRGYTLKQLVETSRLHDICTGEAITYTSDNETHEGRIFETHIAPATSITVNDDGKIDTLENVKCDLTFSVAINASNQNKRVLIPIPEKYQWVDGPLVSVGASGNNQTQSLSMANKNNELYDLSGTAGKITPLNSDIHWSDLVEALAYNKRIDILGDTLKALKIHIIGSGDDYLQFANGTRIYFSKTEPDDADIPDGSIGIGW